MSPLLDIRELSVTTGNNTLVDKVSFTINKGEKLALVGESGSGKSLTAKSLMQLLPDNLSTSGSATLNDRQLLTLKKGELLALRGKKVGMIFQEPLTALNPLHRVGKQLAEAVRIHNPTDNKQAIASKLEQLMKNVNLPDTALLKRYPHELSGGQRQRVMIAMAIANQPELLIADEPTTALDVTIAGEILDLISGLCEKYDMSLLLITHDLNIVKKHADKVCVMRHGKIVEQNNCEDLFNNPASDYTRQLLSSYNNRDLAMPEDKVVLSCKSVSVNYQHRTFLKKNQDSKPALNDINLSLRKSETLGVVGESGSGKSTLARAMLKLLEFDGDILVNDTNLAALGKKQLRNFRKHIQVVFQDPFSSLSPRMSVSEIITEGLKEFRKLNNIEADQAALDMLKETGLDPELLHRFPHELSGGQRQRIAIARALILQPDVLILDEPTSALDHAVQHQIIALLQNLQKKYGTSYVFISHDLASVKAISHQLLVLKNGAAVEHGECLEVLKNPQHPYTRKLLESVK